MVISQGDVVWADLGKPVGAEAGYIRPVIVVQGRTFNLSRIDSYVCIPMTGQIRRANAPGAVLLRATETGLDTDSVAQAHLVLTVDSSRIREQVGKISDQQLHKVLLALDFVLGR